MQRAVAWAIVAVAISACTTLPPTREFERSYEGRFAVTAAWPDRTENTSGRFVLMVRADGITLDLASPLGNTLARIDTDAAGARMTAAAANGETQRLQGASADALAEQALGWPLPVAGLRDWITGRPMPGHPYATGADGAIEQDGWTIRVLERFEASGTPRHLVFERTATPEAPAVTVRLALDGPSG